MLYRATAWLLALNKTSTAFAHQLIHFLCGQEMGNFARTNMDYINSCGPRLCMGKIRFAIRVVVMAKLLNRRGLPRFPCIH